MRTTLCAVGTLCLLIGSCDEPEQKTKAASAKDTAPAQSAPAPKPKPKPKPSTGLSPVEAVQYLPEQCTARGYLNIESLRKHPKVAAQLGGILGRMLSRNARTKETLELMNSTLERGGLRLPGDAGGLAVCAQSADKWISVVTLNVDEVKTGPLALIQKTVNVSGGPSFAPKKEGELRYLSSGDVPGVLSFIADGVLAVANDPKTLARAAEKPGKTDAFGKDLGDMLVAGHFSLGPDNQAKLYLQELDNAIGATLDVSLSKEQGAKAMENRQKFINDLKKGLSAQLSEVETEELKSLAAKVQEASVKINHNSVHATVNISEANVAGLIGTLAEATPNELAKTVDQHLP